MKDTGTEVTTYTDDGHSIPLAIQLFLWRQTEPFFRQKLGRLHEASCVSFEHVLVENKLQGLPPSLYAAINNTGRKKLVEASLPHVMHCAAVLLHNRNKLGQADKLGVPATKLLRTLHSILLEAISNVHARSETEVDNFISNIRLFIFLFAPISNAVKESDLTFRLASGDKLWHALWSHEIPDFPALTTTFSEAQTTGSEEESSLEEFPEINLLPPSNESLDTKNKSDTIRCPLSIGRHHHATLFDIAVLQCLFFPHWSEEGMLWGVTYLLKKLKPASEVKEKLSGSSKCKRSRSMHERTPLPNILQNNKENNLSSMRRNSKELKEKKSSNFFKKQWKSIVIKKKSLTLMTSHRKNSLKSVRRKSYQATENKPDEMREGSKNSCPTKIKESSNNELDDPPPYTLSVGQKARRCSEDPHVSGKMLNHQNTAKTHSYESLLQSPPSYEKITGKHDDAKSIRISVTSELDPCCSREIGNSMYMQRHDDLPSKLNQSHRNWFSDTCIAYTWRSPLSATKHMTSGFVTKEGFLRVDAILDAVEVVATREPNLKVYNVCIQILQIILETVFIKESSGKSGLLDNTLKSFPKGPTDARTILTNLYAEYKDGVSQAIKKEILGENLQKSTDILHLVLVTCTIEFNSTKQGQFNASKWTRKLLEVEMDKEKSLNNAIVTSVFEGFINMCVKQQDIIYSNNNQVLYHEIREFVQFVKKNQPSVFNKVLLTILSVPAKKRKKWKQEKENASSQNIKEKQDKRSVKRRGAVVMENSPLFPRSTSAFARNRNHISNNWTDNEDNDESPRTSSVFGKLPLGNWLRGKQQDSYSDDGVDMNTSLDKGRGEGRSFISLIKGRNHKKQLSYDSDYKESHFDNESNCKPKQQNSNDFEVDPVDILEGTKILKFIMSCCPPGTVPEPKILAASLELESPVIARAAFITEVSAYVHRCCVGDWPKWMTTNSKAYLGSTNHLMRKALKMQTACDKLFYNWGEAISKKLEFIFVSESSNVLQNPRTENEKVKLYLQDSQEDYMKDLTVNESGNNCPVPLKMVVCCLLQEITTFICDAAPYYKRQQKPKSSKSPTLTKRTTCEPPPRLSTSTHSGVVEEKSNSRRRSITFFDQILPMNILQENTSSRKGILESCLRSDEKTKAEKKRDMSPDFLNHAMTADSALNIKFHDYDSSDSSKLLSPEHKINDDSGCFKTRDRAKSLNRQSSLTGSSVHSAGNLLTVPSLYQHGMSPSNTSFSSAISVGSTLSLFSNDEPAPFMEPYGMFSENAGLSMGNDQRLTSHCSSTCGESEDWKNNLPWFSVCLTLANNQNFICDHNSFCHSFCHRRLLRSCARLVQALSIIYEADSLTKNDLECISSSQKNSQYVLRYTKRSMMSLMVLPLNVLLKASVLLPDEMFCDIQSLCWELILDKNKDIAMSAAVLYLLCAIKNPQQVFASLMSEMSNADAKVRLEAILKFKQLWQYRNSVWGMTQDGANKIFKVPLVGMKYSLPKDPVGTKHLPIPDAPWLPHVMDLDQIIAQSSTTTVSHEKEKQIKNAVERAEEEQSSARTAFYLTDVPIAQYIASEVQATQCSTTTIEEEDTVLDFHQRRFSCRLASVCSSTQSYRESRREDSRTPLRQIGRPSKRSSEASGEMREDVSVNRETGKSPVFPPCIAACIPTIIQMFDDNDIGNHNMMIGEIAESVVESCLRDDPELFLGHAFEGVTGTEDPRSLTNLLKKLPLLIGRLPPHVAYTIFVNMLCPIIKTSRNSQPALDENVIACIGILSTIAPYVEGLELKSLKMSLRKEQNDTQLLITGGSPGPRKLTIWNHSDFYMPTLIDVNDECTFESALCEFMKQNEMPIEDNSKYQLIDSALNVITCPHTYIKDFYSFNKTSYPELTFVEMEPGEAEKQIKHRTCLIQMEEINKLKFMLSVLVNHKSSQVSAKEKTSRRTKERQLNASFIMEECLRLKSFPRKAIIAPFYLFNGKFSEEIFDLDMIQKHYWMELISSMFNSLPCEYPWGTELLLFLHVWNAALVVHAEQMYILRRYCAAVIDVACHLHTNFLKFGYETILPTLLKVYSQRHHLPDIRKCIEFLCKQLHILHRQPFILELMASAAPALLCYQQDRFNENRNEHNDNISPEMFVCLLRALDCEAIEDTFQVLPLVQSKNYQHSLDFCYKNESAVITICDCMRLCVTVIACQPESPRTLQMLTVMDAIMPCYLNDLHKQTKLTQTTSTEISTIKDLGTIIRAMLSSMECLTRVCPLPIVVNPHKGGFKDAMGLDASASEKVMEEGFVPSKERIRDKIEECLSPHDLTLHLCTNFYTHAVQRLEHLEINCSQSADIFNDKSHLRLAEIAQTVFKLLPDDCLCIESPGLILYFSNLIPVVDWSNESTRNSLFMVLKRLERVFSKIGSLSSTYREMIRWDGMQNIINGLSKLIRKNSAICAIPHLKSIVNYNLQLLIGGGPITWNDNFSSRIQGTESRLPTPYIPSAIKLIMIYMQTMKNSVRIEVMVRSLIQTKRDCVTINLFIPLCVNVLYAHRENTSDSRLAVRMPVIEADVMYMFTTAFDTLLKHTGNSDDNNISQLLLFTSPVSHKRDNLSQRVALLLIKVLIACFHKLIHKHWFDIALKIKEIATNKLGDVSIWKFMNFIMTFNTPLVLYLRPFVLHQMLKGSLQDKFEQSAKESLKLTLTQQKYRNIDVSLLLSEFEVEMQLLREEFKSCSRLNNKFGDKVTREKPRVNSFRHAVLPGAFGRKGSGRQEMPSPDKMKRSSTKHKGSYESHGSELASPNASPRLYQQNRKLERRSSGKRWGNRRASFYANKDRRKRFSESSTVFGRRTGNATVNRSQSVRHERMQSSAPIPEITVDLVETPQNNRRTVTSSVGAQGNVNDLDTESPGLVRRRTLPLTKSAQKKMNIPDSPKFVRNIQHKTTEMNGDAHSTSTSSTSETFDPYDVTADDSEMSDESEVFQSEPTSSLIPSPAKLANKSPVRRKLRDRSKLNFQNLSATVDKNFTTTILSPVIESPGANPHRSHITDNSNNVQNN